MGIEAQGTWKRECHNQVQCYPLKTCHCKDQEMPAGKEKERSLQGKESGKLTDRTRLVRG